MNPSVPPPPAAERARFYTGWTRDRGLFGESGVGILMYHKISAPTPGTRWPGLYVQPGGLARQVDELLAAGLPCVPYDGALAAIRRGERGFCLTFDDGFLSVLENALPVLRPRRVRAMLFVVAGLIGGSDEWDHPIGEGPHALMDDGHLREWLAAGHEIGAHTLTHPHLTRLPRARARAEIFGSKAVLEDRFGVPVRHFCYPYGDQDEAVRDLVAEAGFVDAPTAGGEENPGTNPVDVDAFQLRRLWACDPGNLA